MITVEAQCQVCSGTGLYRGMCEPEGVAAVCRVCNGEGKRVIVYKPFKKRVIRNDVHKVCLDRMDRTFDYDALGDSITYQQFLDGHRP